MFDGRSASELKLPIVTLKTISGLVLKGVLVYATTVNVPHGCKRIRLSEELYCERKVTLATDDNQLFEGELDSIFKEGDTVRDAVLRGGRGGSGSELFLILRDTMCQILK